MATTPKEVSAGLIVALRDVRDVDSLHLLISSNGTDEFSFGEFATWLRELVSSERRRRRSGEASTQYRFYDFANLEAPYLVRAMWLAIEIDDAATLAGEKSNRAFTRQLVKLLAASMSSCLIHRYDGQRRAPMKD